MKKTMMQYFEWDLPADASHWKRLEKDASHLEQLGINMVWTPPAYKGLSGVNDVGYGVYDMYDLGEFDQKGSIPTKYGTKGEYLKAIDALHDKGIQVLADVVFNQRMGADETEKVLVREVDGSNRNQVISEEYEREMWTKFNFPGRNGQYSDFKWNWTCFTGTDFNDNGRNGIVLFQGKSWDQKVSQEQGNFDFIMGCDVDFQVDYVLEELYRWAQWYIETTHVDGFRIDAVKSIDSGFFNRWLEIMWKQIGEDRAIAVGEYWSGNVQELEQYLDDCQQSMRLFDVPLHFRLCSEARQEGNVRDIFSQSLTQNRPEQSVAFVDNHDTQPGQALESWVAEPFKTSAYALILLHACSLPCVFYGDLYGLPSRNIAPTPYLEELIWIRSHLLGDEIQEVNSDRASEKAWVVHGDHPVLVYLAQGEEGHITIQNEALKGKQFVCVMNPDERITFSENGEASLYVPGWCARVWILEEDWHQLQQAFGRE